MELSAHPQPVSRRQFLAGGATVLAAAWLLGPAGLRGRPNPLLQLLADGGRASSVGFVDGVRDLLDAAGMRAVPARSLSSGDGALVGEAVHVRVRGVAPALDQPAGPALRSLSLDVLVAPPDRRATEPLPFHAWSFAGYPQPQPSSPVGFTAAVADEPSLGLAVDVVSHAAGQDEEQQRERSLAVFTTGRDRELPKLREGLYLVAIAPGVWDRPRRVPASDDPAWGDLRSLIVSVGRHGATAAP